MGIKHLESIQNLLKKDSKSYSKTELRDTLRIDYQTVLDALSYLLHANFITKSKKIGEVEKFKWKQSQDGKRGAKVAAPTATKVIK